MKKKLLSLLLAIVMIVSIIPAAFAESAYADVPADAWYAQYVDYVTRRGFMEGVGENKFAPKMIMTRAMAVKVLHRMAFLMDLAPSNIEERTENPFTDVAPGDWFYKSVLWAHWIGITNGTSATTFSPNDKITREQLVTMLWKLAGHFGETYHADISSYADVDDVSDWAFDAFSWAIGEEIITGVGNNRLAPRVKTNRAECAAVIARYYHLIRPIDPDTCEHVWFGVGGYDNKEATCTEDGKQAYSCMNCHHRKYEIIPALGHAWDDGVVTKEPTETEDGIMTYTCERCHETREEVIPATGKFNHN